MATTITVPSTLNLTSAIKLVETLRSVPGDSEYNFDFLSMGWAEPLGMLYVAHAIREFVSAHRGTNMTASNFSGVGSACHSYCAHMGFFKTFGLSHGNLPGEAKGSSSYVPISEVLVPDLKAEAFDTGQSVQCLVQEKSLDLARVLTQAKQCDIRDALAFSFREILRNAVEHSESDRMWVCAQYWPSKKMATIGILDEGIGLRASLGTNPYLNVKDDKDAIRFALLPGISGKFFAGSKENQWDNAGYGLYMTSSLARAGGSFTIVSGACGLSWGRRSRSYFVANMSGTALEVTLDTSVVTGLDERLDQFVRHGEHIERVCARLLETGGLLSGESASKLLRGDI